MKKCFKFLNLLATFCLIGCYDTQYENIEEYYDYFGDNVYLEYFGEEGISSSSSTASLEDNFYNERTANDFDEECLVDSEYYAYLAVCLEDDSEHEFDDFVLYIKAEKDALVEIRIFVIDDLPDKLRGFNDPSSGGAASYDDNFTDPCATIIAQFSKDTFTDVFVKKWIVDGNQDNKLTIKPDQYFFVQFINNTGYGKDAGYESVKFTATNFILSKS